VLTETSGDSAFASPDGGTQRPKIVVDGEEVDPESLGLDEEKVLQLAGTISSITVKAVKP